MEVLRNVLVEIWSITAIMAPYLLFGFLMAGVLSVVISKDFVRRHLGGSGWAQPVKAALMGVPMPICSCGVIPLAASLRGHGASRGATASFLASTPQTGVDSLLASYALLGGVFAVVRAVVAFLTGLVCGAAVGAVSDDGGEAAGGEEACDETCCAGLKAPGWRRALVYGFVTLPRGIGRAMAFGIVLSGVIGALVPPDFFASRIGHSPWAYLLMLAVGIPLYVCSSGSVPIALAFIKAGLSPGAALVFLIAGPATNAATLTTLWQIIGKKQTVVFMLVLALCALAAGVVLDGLGARFDVVGEVAPRVSESGALDFVWAGALLLTLGNGMRKR